MTLDADQTLPNHTDSNCRRPQVSHTYTHTHTHSYKHTPVETAIFSNEIGQNIIIWYPQFLRSFKQESSGLISKTIWHSYCSHVSSSYYVSRQVLASPPGSRNTLIYTHINSHAVLICRIGLGWLLYLRLKFEV
jgi:hypothetical protein